VLPLPLPGHRHHHQQNARLKRVLSNKETDLATAISERDQYLKRLRKIQSDFSR
jgi:hypothetical protein